MAQVVEPPKKKGRNWLAIIGGLVGLCIVCGIIGQIYNMTPQGQASQATRTAEAVAQVNADATEAAKPTNTPAPTATTGPTETPSPTDTPEPTETPEPTATIPATPDPQLFSGTSSSITEDFTAPADVMILDATHSGDSNFIVQLYSADAEMEDININAIGDYTGSGIVDLDPGADYYFDVIADGAWELNLRDPDFANAATLPASFEGKDSTVLVPVRLSEGRVNVTFTHTGEGNFIVQVHSGEDGDMEDIVANDIGSVENGTAAFRADEDGYYLFAVIADGSWTIALE